jgi:hypothetical protein
LLIRKKERDYAALIRKTSGLTFKNFTVARFTKRANAKDIKTPTFTIAISK